MKAHSILLALLLIVFILPCSLDIYANHIGSEQYVVKSIDNIQHVQHKTQQAAKSAIQKVRVPANAHPYGKVRVVEYDTSWIDTPKGKQPLVTPIIKYKEKANPDTVSEEDESTAVSETTEHLEEGEDTVPSAYADCENFRDSSSHGFLSGIPLLFRILLGGIVIVVLFLLISWWVNSMAEKRKQKWRNRMSDHGHTSTQPKKAFQEKHSATQHDNTIYVNSKGEADNKKDHS